jgi:protein-tyrosine-phosphatase
MNILFVCSGNVSRSFLAEKLLENEIRLRELYNVSVASAGLFVYPGNPPDPKIVEYLLQKGISVEQHESRQITAEDVDWADHILVMERGHVKRLEELWPHIKDKVELLAKFATGGLNEDEIIDPYGKSPYHYRLAEAQITLAIEALITRIKSL